MAMPFVIPFDKHHGNVAKLYNLINITQLAKIPPTCAFPRFGSHDIHVFTDNLQNIYLTNNHIRCTLSQHNYFDFM